MILSFGAVRAARYQRGRAILACVVAASLASAPALAAGTQAGTTISNVATATYGPPDDETTVTSNIVELRVDELLNVTVASADPGDVTVLPGAVAQVLKFTVTNSGNGSEAFTLSTDDQVGGDDFNPAVTSIVLDSNNNGVYDPGVDTVYVAGTNDPTLAPDASITVFVLSSIPAGAEDRDRGGVELTASAKTGTGAAGTIFPGAGTGGGDAVVGATTATANARGYYEVAAVSLSFTKSATVADPFGGTTQVPGSIITYSLVATVSGTGSLPDVRITDPIPAGASYQAGTIRLNGTLLTDAADGDGGRYAAGQISVSLGTVPAGTSHTITFQVKID